VTDDTDAHAHLPGAPRRPFHGEVVAEVVRSGVVEGRHHGAVVALRPDGRTAWSTGSVDAWVFPRSCNKPLQAVAMVEAGLDLPPDLLALACASHSGEPDHVDRVRAILAGAGLDESALQNPPDLPMQASVRDAALRAGAEPSRVLMNCSGKHAAMLATCVGNGWDTATYLDVDHPLQRHVATVHSRLTGDPVAHVAVDGCGAPQLSASVTGLAWAFRCLAQATEGAEHRVAEAIRAHPALVSGSTRDERALLDAVPGAIGKLGAEGCYAVALPDGHAVALKIEDGSDRPRPVVMAAALERLGVLDLPGVDAAAVRATGRVTISGGGSVVGEVRPRLPAT